MFSGIKRGFELIAEWFAAMLQALTDANEPMQRDLMEVARIWFSEATGESMNAKKWSVQVGLTALMFGRDPFSGSRQAFYSVKLRYNLPGH